MAVPREEHYRAAARILAAAPYRDAAGSIRHALPPQDEVARIIAEETTPRRTEPPGAAAIEADEEFASFVTACIVVASLVAGVIIASLWR
jgi:hypothetical protein